jgi:hypothetical protein
MKLRRSGQNGGVLRCAQNDKEFLFGHEQGQRQEMQMRGFFPFDYAQGQNDKLLFVAWCW